LDVAAFTDAKGATDLDQLLNRAAPSFARADLVMWGAAARAVRDRVSGRLRCGGSHIWQRISEDPFGDC